MNSKAENTMESHPFMTFENCSCGVDDILPPTQNLDIDCTQRAMILVTHQSHRYQYLQHTRTDKERKGDSHPLV